MPIYMKVNGLGFPIGFYNTDLHRYTVPEGAIEVTKDQWLELLDNPFRKIWKNGQVVDYMPPTTQVDLIAYAAEKRWQKETGGFEFNGLHIATDDRSKIMIAGAREAAKGNPDFTTPWVTSTGEIALLDAAAIIAISDAVGAHVNNVFDIYSQVLPQILDGTLTDQTQIDAAFA